MNQNITNFSGITANFASQDLTAYFTDDESEEVSQEIQYSFFRNKKDALPTVLTTTFDQLEEACQTPTIRQEKDGCAFCPALFWPEYREAANAKECSFLGFDLDNLPDDITSEDVLSCISGFRGFTYTTFSHKEPGKGNRFRVVVQLAQPMPSHFYKSIAKVFGTRFLALGGKIDSNCTSPAQMLFYPACPKERKHQFEFESQQGKSLDWTLLLDSQILEDHGSVYVEPMATTPGSMIPEGERNKTLFKMGAALRGDGKEFQDIYAELQQRNQELCIPPLDEDEVLAIAQSAAKYNPRDIVHEEDALTELVLAKSVAQTHKGTIQWIPEWHTWMRLNPRTKLWERERTETIIGLLLLDLEQRRVREASLVMETGANRSKAFKEIERAGKASFHTGSEKLLRTVSGCALHPDDFDADHYLVGLPDGKCLDLKTVTVREITSEDYLTKRLSAPYVSDADCPVWKRSIEEWCCGDKELEKFLHVWCGYSLSGLTDFQAFLFLHGGGCNGKSVFINVISDLMNNYAKAISPTTLMMKQNTGGATSDIARLQGARLVTSAELPEGKQFDEILLKQLTGGDTVTARNLYQSEFSYKPTLKLMIAGNHEPVITGSDDGIWRRVVDLHANLTRILH